MDDQIIAELVKLMQKKQESDRENHNADIKVQIDKILQELSEEERLVLAKRFGLEDLAPKRDAE